MFIMERHIVVFDSLLLVLWQHVFTFARGRGRCCSNIILTRFNIAPPIRPAVEYKVHNANHSLCEKEVYRKLGIRK